MGTTPKIVRFFMCCHTKAHHQFKRFLEELSLEDRLNDIPFCLLVRWLTVRNVLNVFVELLEPTAHFLKRKSPAR
jgi:hypothetical protein